jgi:hypothetical protein
LTPPSARLIFTRGGDYAGAPQPDCKRLLRGD